MTKKNSKTPYATFNGQPDLYVKLKATAINPLIVFIDGLPVRIINPKSKRPEHFMKVTDVIAWHEKELKETSGQSGSAKALALLKTALKKFENQNASTELIE